MFKKIVLPLIALINTCFAQDTLVNYSEITFSSPFEKNVLDDHFLNKKTNLFNLFMANGAQLNEVQIDKANERFYDHLKQLAQEPALNKRNDKKLKYIYDDIHQTFLSKYELQNKFEDIFYNGYYNCVSASALYTLVFENLGIPYAIKEKPTHVYLIAFPSGERIIVETTSPSSAYNSINQEFKTGFVKMLKDQKMISSKEYTAEDTNVLFDKFYFSEQEEISFLNLIGVQYMNDGLYKFEDKQYIEALRQLEKAYLFYPSKRIAYLLMMALSSAMDESKGNYDKRAEYLSRLSRFKDYGYSTDIIRSEFSRIVYSLLFESANKPKLDQYYHKLDSSLHDNELKKELSAIYHYESGRFFYNQAHYKNAIPSLEKAMELKPNNLEVNNLFIASIAQNLESSGINPDVIKKLEDYAAKYTSLQSNNLFNKLLGTAYLLEFGSAYDFNKPIEGDKYKKLFESHMSKFSDLSIDNIHIGRAYSMAAVYYFRKGQTSKSKSIIDKGLMYAPTNTELLTRQRMIK